MFAAPAVHIRSLFNALQATRGHVATSELFNSINSVIICSLKVSANFYGCMIANSMVGHMPC